MPHWNLEGLWMARKMHRACESRQSKFVLLRLVLGLVIGCLVDVLFVSLGLLGLLDVSIVLCIALCLYHWFVYIYIYKKHKQCRQEERLLCAENAAETHLHHVFIHVMHKFGIGFRRFHAQSLSPWEYTAFEVDLLRKSSMRIHVWAEAKLTDTVGCCSSELKLLEHVLLEAFFVTLHQFRVWTRNSLNSLPWQRFARTETSVWSCVFRRVAQFGSATRPGFWANALQSETIQPTPCGGGRETNQQAYRKQTSSTVQSHVPCYYIL